MYDRSLTEELMDYRRTGMGRKKLIDSITLRVYHMAGLKDDWDEDDVGDFILFFLPKIPALLEQYKETGSSFEVYLYVHTMWNIRGFAKKLRTRKYEENLNSAETFWEVHESNPENVLERGPDVPEEIRKLYQITPDGSLDSPVWKQRFLFLIFRETEYIDNSLLENIVEATGLNRKWILNCISALKERMRKRLHRLNILRQNRNYWFYRYYLLQLRLTDTYDSESREKLLPSLEQARSKFTAAREKVERLHTRPTNRDISEVLNIPKGSIDSGIFYVLNRYKNRHLYEEEAFTEGSSELPATYKEAA